MVICSVIAVVLTCSHSNAAPTESADTVAAALTKAELDTVSSGYKDLEEVTVEGVRVIRGVNILKLFPSKRDKRFAAGGRDVLVNMNIPEVTVNPMSGDVRYAGGEPMTFFIDFQQASSRQIAEVRPQDIERIDIINNPQDPRFNGARVVANYIMKKYEYGGYTKLDASQFFPVFNGVYNLYSKFSCKRMTYDFSTGMTYSKKDNRAGTEEISSYKFDDLDIVRQSVTTGYKRMNILPHVSGRAIYNYKNTSIANTFGFNYSRLKPFDTFGKVEFSDLFAPSENSRTARKYSKSAVWNGNCWFGLKNNYSLSFDGGFEWSENDDNSTYTLAGYAPIVNDINEKVINTYGSLNLSKQIGNHSVGAMGSCYWQRNELVYASSSEDKVDYSEWFGQLRIEGNFQFDKYSVSPSLTLCLISEKFNGRSSHKWLPKAFIPFYLQINSRSSFSGSFEFAVGAPSASDRSPVLLRQNEVDAIRGNELLGNYDFYNVRLGYSNNFAKWLSLRVDAKFTCNDHPIVPVYSELLSSVGTPLMVRDFINSGSVYNSSLAVNLSGRYLDGNLVLGVAGSVHYFGQRGVRKRDKWVSLGWLNASYYIKDFRISGYIAPPSRIYGSWSDSKSPLFWFLSASWSWNDFFVDIRFSNPFMKSYKSNVKYVSSDVYSSKQTSFDNVYHQSIKVTLSYSFGYGKKLDRRDEVRKVDGPQSIILTNQ